MLISTRQHSLMLPLPHTALIVIDLQNDFCHPNGFCHHHLGADIASIRAIIPRVQAMIVWARKHRIPVIYTRESHAPDLSDATACKQLRYANAGHPIGTVGKMGRFLIRGEAGCALIDELQPLPTELQIDKPAQSIFIGTTLAATLQQQQITHLLFTGVTTACCVLASYRQASDLGFYGLLLADCCAAFTDAEQQAAIAVLLGENGAIGWVSTSDPLLNA
jgi:biuret amidohydrolase